MIGQDTSPEENFSDQNEWNAHEAARRLQIGKFFIRELGKKGWTQTQLADRVGCSQPW